ncbi:MAG: CHAD domain-containing protein [Methyloceanibacter sp.]|uniref:CHAD domain-containing protein n=1 Tax=Methyloceanibacter sp. TaxID=1965321 RepID=UPI003D6D195F
MSYRLDPALPMSEALRCVAFAELEIAHGSLSTPPDRHTGVHSARKCLKRLRSLLMLARPGMPEPILRNLTDRIASIAKGLAAARDAQALIDALDKLERHTEPGPGQGPIQSIRGWLRKRRQAAEQNLENSTASEAMRRLLELRPAFAGLAVYPDDFSPLARGLERCYRAARKSFKASLDADEADDIHEWRKGVQHHWRQMQLLTPCWPSELSARVEAARSLSQLLGDDHDIAVLLHLVSMPTMTFGTPDETAAFIKRCHRRHKVLRKEARIKGERLFIEKARPFAERIEAYWSTASVAGDKPAPAVRPQQPGNVVAFGEARTGRANQS